jgi:hypothetical protein
MKSTAILATLLLTLPLPRAAANEPEITGQAGSDAYEIVGEWANGAAQEFSDTQPLNVSGEGGSVFVAYRWRSVCQGAFFTDEPAVQMDCGAARVCAEDSERLYRLWGRLESGEWVALGAQCLGAPPADEKTPAARVTAAMVLEELRRIGLPTLQARTQPEGKTLVNFDTIFYTDAEPFSATVTLLGRQVDVTAEPTSYTWHHGDGTKRTTTNPGAPYPSQEITYRYSDAETTVSPRVDVTYRARFRVGSGAWQDIDETVTIPGPEGSLRIAQARAALSGDYS